MDEESPDDNELDFIVILDITINTSDRFHFIKTGIHSKLDDRSDLI